MVQCCPIHLLTLLSCQWTNIASEAVSTGIPQSIHYQSVKHWLTNTTTDFYKTQWMLLTLVLHIFLLCFTLVFCWQIQITVLILQICHLLTPSQLLSVKKKGDKTCNTSKRRVLCIHRIQYITPVLRKWNWSLTLWNAPPWILKCAKWIENIEQEGCGYILFVWLWAFYRCCYKEQIKIKSKCGIMNESGMWHI